MKKRATIKDIAKEAGVSPGAVHIALSGKPGVSDQTRKRIREIARQNNYQPNAMAASLKGKVTRIAMVFPGAVEDNRFYFTHIWQGVKDYCALMRDFNVEAIEVPYYPDATGRDSELDKLLGNMEIDGLITTGYNHMKGPLDIQKFVQKGIPVVLIGTDLPQSGRLCCVQPNYQIVGRTLAELITRQIAPNQPILICAGRVFVPSHYEIVEGIDKYLADNGLKNPVYKIHSDVIEQMGEEYIAEMLVEKQIAACCCVNARNSIQMGKAILLANRAGTITAVGTDLFEENVEFLRQGVFSNLLQNNPYRQAYQGALYLLGYLLHDQAPPMDRIYMGSEIVFQSSLPMYDNGSYRLLL